MSLVAAGRLGWVPILGAPVPLSFLLHEILLELLFNLILEFFLIGLLLLLRLLLLFFIYFVSSCGGSTISGICIFFSF